MLPRSSLGHLLVASVLLLFLSVLTACLWLVLHALRAPLAPMMAGMSLTFVLAWLVSFVATIYVDLFFRLNSKDE